MKRGLADRRGFALPVVILVVALLTVLLTSGLARARTERQIAHASDETSEALAVAQSGLQTYFGTVTTRPLDGDSVRINTSGGYANVVPLLVRQPADTLEESLYLVRSTGFVINPDSGSVPRARHTVAQFATWGIARIERMGALTAINGVRHQNNNPNPSRLEVSGVDGCAQRPSIPGIRTDNMVWSGPPDPDTSFAGSPGGLVVESGAAIAAALRMDWAGILGGELVPDYSTFQNGNSSYPIQRVMGSLTLAGTTSGSGLLVVEDDLWITGSSFTFDGIMLVGGRIRFEADVQTVRGLIVTGLDLSGQRTETGGNPAENQRDAFLSYNSCNVQQVLARIAGLSPVRNAWLDIWATY